jgi:hypothetical protein
MLFWFQKPLIKKKKTKERTVVIQPRKPIVIFSITFFDSFSVAVFVGKFQLCDIDTDVSDRDYLQLVDQVANHAKKDLSATYSMQIHVTLFVVQNMSPFSAQLTIRYI